MKAHWLRACRSLPRCSSSIRCSIRSGRIRASKNSPPRPRRNKTWLPRLQRKFSSKSRMYWFTDIVGYSKLPIHQQRAVVERLNEIVRGTDEFQAAETAGRLIKLPPGDGITLVFYHSPEAPVECALEISRALKKHPELQLRMGIHSGPVSGIVDATGKANVAGAGINMAQRVMDCGDAGHILLSKHVAEDLEEYPHWQPYLHELGECEVKHGVRVSVVNLYTAELGNPAVPERLKAARVAAAAARRKRAAFRWLSLGVVSLLSVIAVIGFLLFRYRRPLATVEF